MSRTRLDGPLMAEQGEIRSDPLVSYGSHDRPTACPIAIGINCTARDPTHYRDRRLEIDGLPQGRSQSPT